MRVTFVDSIPGRRLDAVPIDLPESSVTLRDLIRRRVYAAVEQYNEDRPEVYRGLVEPEEAERLLNGYRLKVARELDPEREFQRAVRAFEKQGYVVMAGGRQVESLDESLDLQDSQEVEFLRLFPLAGGSSAVDQMIAELSVFGNNYFAEMKRSEDAAEAVRKFSAEQLIEFVMKVVRIQAEDHGHSRMLLSKPLSAALRKKLPFAADQILELVRLGSNPSYYYPFATVLRLAESAPKSDELVQAVKAMRNASVLRGRQVSGTDDLLQRIEEFGRAPKFALAFEPAGNWSRVIAEEVTPDWREVLEAGKEITGSEPPKKWLAAAEKRVDGIGRQELRVTALRWLALGPNPGDTEQQISSEEADYQRGLLWSLTGFADAETCSAIARFAEQCLRKIPMIGAVAHKPANACVKVLSAMNGMEPVAQLARLAMRVRYQTAQRLVQEALDEAASRQGISRDQLAEITVPTFDLNEDGVREERLGDCIVTLNSSGELLYRKSELKGFADEMKALKQAAKEIAAMASAHRARVERLLMSQRAIDADIWRENYLQHPLISRLARVLIWQFGSGKTAIWRDGRMVDWSNNEVPVEGPVRLWHPISSDVQTVLSWRCWLEDNGVKQPFKQAHREVYLLTDAERETRTVSNRFRGHILKQHPFAAIAEQRGWRFKLMGQWDSHNTPYLELPDLGLRAEFRIDFPRDEEAISGHAIYLFIESETVAFVDPKTYEERPLESISPVVFSEVMRDVDLFTGVCSIGNDPEWGTKPSAPFQQYWETASFGELSAVAEQRRDLLARLIPKLSIASQCRLEGKYLWVDGKRAQYKIHLGTSNVMMEPGSRYLCIVRGAGNSNVFLPFDGDATLSLILSKAFLFAADHKITDPSITRQLPV